MKKAEFWNILPNFLPQKLNQNIQQNFLSLKINSRTLFLTILTHFSQFVETLGQIFRQYFE